MTLYTGEIHQKVVHKWTIALEEIPEEGSITSPIFKDVGYEWQMVLSKTPSFELIQNTFQFSPEPVPGSINNLVTPVTPVRCVTLPQTSCFQVQSPSLTTVTPPIKKLCSIPTAISPGSALSVHATPVTPLSYVVYHAPTSPVIVLSGDGHTFHCRLKNTKSISGDVELKFLYKRDIEKVQFAKSKSSTAYQITVEHYSIPVSPAEKSSITLEFTFHKADVRSVEYCLDSDSDSDKKIYDFSTKKFVPLKQHVQSSNDYLVLLNNKNFSDVSIIINDQVIYAHKCILAVKSPVFASMFDTAMIENKANEVRIDDIKYEVLYEMLRFMYTGVVSKLINLAADLFYAADKYGIEQLKIMCVRQLIKNMNADNVIGYVYLADSHSNDLLKNKAIQFIVNNAKDVVQKSEFKELSIQNPIFYEIFKALASK